MMFASKDPQVCFVGLESFKFEFAVHNVAVDEEVAAVIGQESEQGIVEMADEEVEGDPMIQEEIDNGMDEMVDEEVEHINQDPVDDTERGKSMQSVLNRYNSLGRQWGITN